MWCAVNQLSAMNTWFEKLEHEQGTRCHPATKQYHLIDMIAAGSLQGCQCWSWGKLLYRPSHGTRKVQYHCCDPSDSLKCQERVTTRHKDNY